MTNTKTSTKTSPKKEEAGPQWWRRPDGTLCYGSEDDCMHVEINQEKKLMEMVHNPKAKNCKIPGSAEDPMDIFDKLWKDPTTTVKKIDRI